MSLKTNKTEDEKTRLSVCLRLSLILCALGLLVGCFGMFVFTRGIGWGQFPFGAGVGILLSASFVAFDAYRNFGLDRASLVCD